VIDIDYTAIMYLILTLLGAYGFGLFLWWWKKKGSASSVFMGMTFLLLGVAYNFGIALYARYLHLYNCKESYLEFIEYIIWDSRTLILFGALVYIIGKMSLRVFGSNRNNNKD